MDFRHIFAYPLFMFQGPSTRKTFVVACKKCRRDVPTGVAEFPFQSIIVECALCGEKRRYLPSEVFLGWADQLVARQKRAGGADVRSRRQHAPHQPGKGAPDIRNWRQIDDGYRARQSCTLILKLREGKDKFPRQAIFAITHGT